MKTVRVTVAAPGHIPVPTGCRKADDCFTCPYKDCTEIANYLTSGNVPYEKAHYNGLKREAYARYNAGYTVREVAAIMKEPALRVSQWIIKMRREAALS